MMFLIDSSYEEFVKNSPEASFVDFAIHLDKMNTSGALFDMQKLRFFNNGYLSKISNQELFDKTLTRAKKYDEKLAHYMQEEAAYALAALSIERLTEKDPKRYTTYKDIAPNVLFFFDAEWKAIQATKPALPEFMTQELLQKIVTKYVSVLDLSMDTQAWFEQLKSVGKEFGFASSNQEFKE